MAEYSKLGYGNSTALDEAITNGKIDGKDIVVTKDTSELIYIRDDKTKQVIRSRNMIFESAEEAAEKLNRENSGAYASQIVMIKDENDKYDPYIVQKDADADKFIVEAVSAASAGFVWQEF